MQEPTYQSLKSLKPRNQFPKKALKRDFAEYVVGAWMRCNIRPQMERWTIRRPEDQQFTIITEHQVSDEKQFWGCYVHLSGP